MDHPEFVVPLIHRGGTSKKELMDLRRHVCSHLRKSLVALEMASPNGRDYHLVPGLMEDAVAHHQRRVEAVQAVLDSVEAEMLAIQEKYP